MSMKRYIALILSAVLAANSCLPVLASEQPNIEMEAANEAATTDGGKETEIQPEEAVAEDETPEVPDEAGEGATEGSENVSSETSSETSTESAATANENAEEAVKEEVYDETTDEAVVQEKQETVSDDAGNGHDAPETGTSTGETSEWLQDYSYVTIVSDNTRYVNLEYYQGDEIDVSVPGSAVINGENYTVTATSNAWNNGIESLTFGEGFVFPKDCSGYFANMSSLISVDLSGAQLGDDYFGWEAASMESMFANCYNLQHVELNIAVDSVIDVSYMFSECSSLETLDLSCFSGSFDVHYFDGLFIDCSSLRTLNLGGWDWSGADDDEVDLVFSGCSSLEEIITPSNVYLPVALPFLMMDDDGTIYDCLPRSTASVTLHTAAVSEWLEEYDYDIDHDTHTVYPTQYYGDDTEITLPGSAMIGNETYYVALNRCPWYSYDITSIVFGEGVHFEGYLYEFFSELPGLESVDLRNVDFSGVHEFYDPFPNNNELRSLSIPANTGVSIELPAIFVGDDGNQYSTIPGNLSYSITLQRAEVSEWLKEYGYDLDQDTHSVSLNQYYGDDTEITLPGSAMIGNETYYVTLNHCPWNSPEITNISFEEGVRFKGYIYNFFSGLPGLESVDLRNVDFSGVREFYNPFRYNNKLRSLSLPANTGVSIELPALFIGDDGNRYATVPGDLSYGITLQRAEVSDWLKDYNYSISGDTVTLQRYSGEGGNLVVFNHAVIDGEEFTKINVNSNCWSDAGSYSISFEHGVLLTDQLSGFFDYDLSVEAVDFSELGGAVVTKANWMFDACSYLRNLDLSGLDFSNCISANNMLYGCNNLETIKTPIGVAIEIKLPGAYLDEEGNIYTEMPKNVGHSITLTRAEISDWLLDYDYSVENDRIVLNYYHPRNDGYGPGYYGDNSIVNVPGYAVIGTKEFNHVEIKQEVWYNTVHELSFGSGVILPADSSEMFTYGYLEKIDLSEVDFSEVENAEGMFKWCENLTTIITPKNLTSEIGLPGVYTDESGYLYTALPQNSVESITLTKTEAGNWVDEYEFYVEGDKIVLTKYNGSATDIIVPGSCEIGNKTFNRVLLSAYVYNNYGPGGSTITSLSFGEGVEFPDDCSSLFNGLSNLISIDLSNVNTSNVTNMNEMFSGCSALPEIDLAGMDTSNVTDMSYMFNYCSSLQELDVSGFDTSNVTRMEGVFEGCSSLTSLDVSGFDTSNVTYISYMFWRCDALLELDISSWDLHSLQNGRRMFSGKIPVIHAPANVPERCDLRALYMGSDGLTYNCLPINVDRSILLTWVSESGDPTGSLSGDPGESGDPGQKEITIVSHPVDAEVREGETASFYVGAEGNDLQYQWQWSADGSTWKNCTAAGFNTDTFSFTMAEKYAGRSYRCVITSGTQTVYSGSATVTLASASEITVQPEDANVKEGETAEFHVEASGEEVSYQWQWSADGETWKNCTSSGYNTDTLSFVMQERFAGRHYRCVITADGDTLTSEMATVMLASTPEITVQPEDAYVKAGETAEFHVEASGEEVSYQWQYSLNGTKWSNCTSSGYNTDTLSFVMQERFAGRQYRCVITADGETLISDAATVNLKAASEITAQPEDAFVPVGETASFHVEFSGNDSSYQWQWSADGKTWKNCTSSGYNTDTFSFVMQEKYAGRQYRCVITADGETLTSNAATANLRAADGITSQPEDATVKEGDTASFHVEFSGNTPSYQWQWSADGKTWKNCTASSYNTDTFCFVMNERFTGRQYRCVITAGGQTYTSDSATVSIAEDTLITESPVDVTVKEGQTASFHVGTTASGVTYQWQWSADGITWKNCTGAGYNTDTFSFKTQKKYSGRSYRCMVTDGTKTEYSESGLLTVTK